MPTSEKRGLDYYGVLGITKGATDAEIKETYKKLSIQYNPLRNKCSDTKTLTMFKLLGEAYEVLSNSLLKCIYDQYGEAGLKKGVYTILGWNHPWQYHGDPYQTFKNFFGTSNPYADIIYCMHEMLDVSKNSRRSDLKVKQPAIERDLALTLEEVYFGTMKKLKIKRRVYDKDQVTTSFQEKVLCIRIQPGTPNGTKIIFRNVGDEGPNTIPGDLIITTKDIPHKRFQRNGVDLTLAVTLDLHRAIGEITIELHTIDCRIIRFAITDVIVPGYTKSVPGEGMPYVNDVMKKGDLHVTFSVVFPKYLTEAAKRKIIEAIIGSGSPEMEKDSPEVIQMILTAEKIKRNKGIIEASEIKEEEEPKNSCDDFLEINKDTIIYRI